MLGALQCHSNSQRPQDQHHQHHEAATATMYVYAAELVHLPQTHSHSQPPFPSAGAFAHTTAATQDTCAELATVPKALR